MVVRRLVWLLFFAVAGGGKREASSDREDESGRLVFGDGFDEEKIRMLHGNSLGRGRWRRWRERGRLIGNYGDSPGSGGFGWQWCCSPEKAAMWFQRKCRCFDGGIDGVVWRKDAVVMAWWFWVVLFIGGAPSEGIPAVVIMEDLVVLRRSCLVAGEKKEEGDREEVRIRDLLFCEWWWRGVGLDFPVDSDVRR
ncbi:hypothetical protein HAX54_014740 [Datura stramonium]|uniref:Uncharacterized protein n=1 Tax=Datura stramonium TaxID=4076 RepID=A0ABS8TRE8_DATST|nr:hypothetical protein [Datura stramonium]